MSFETLTDEISTWPDSQVNKLQAWLFVMKRGRDQARAERLGAKLDDKDPDRWVTLDEAARKLDLTGE